MRATDLLRAQHRDVDDLFREFEEADDDGERAELFDLLAARLVAHEMIERELFHPACRGALGEADSFLADSVVEHGVVFVCITEAERAEDAYFRQAVAILREVVAQHARHEETELFARIEARLDRRALDDLGARMAHRFEMAMASDLHTAVRLELQQLFPFGERNFGEEAAPEPRIEA
jgi:hypothetical protein